MRACRARRRLLSAAAIFLPILYQLLPIIILSSFRLCSHLSVQDGSAHAAPRRFTPRAPDAPRYALFDTLSRFLFDATVASYCVTLP